MAINNPLKIAALEIEEELVSAIEDSGPRGLTYKEAADLLGMDYAQLYAAANVVESMGKIRGVRSARGYRLILPGWKEPDVYVLSERQRRVLEYLCSVMGPDHLIRVSFNAIFKATGASYDAVQRLDYKGFLQVIERGHSTTAALYQVFPDQNGPPGYSPWKSYLHVKTDRGEGK